MTRTIAVITFLCYFAVTSGIIVNYHYCMNRLNSTQFYVAESDYCTRCGMHTDSRGCCKDDVKIVKMQIDQNTTSLVSFELPALESVGICPSHFIQLPFTNGETALLSRYHSPPPPGGRDTYIDNCVFRI